MSHYTEYEIQNTYTPYIRRDSGYDNSIAHVNHTPGVSIYEIIDQYLKQKNTVMPALGLNKPGIIGHDGVGRPIYEIYTYIDQGYSTIGDILNPLFYPNTNTDLFILDAKAVMEAGFPTTDTSLPATAAIATPQLWGWSADSVGNVVFVDYLGNVPAMNGRAIIRFKKTNSTLIG